MPGSLDARAQKKLSAMQGAATQLQGRLKKFVGACHRTATPAPIAIASSGNIGNTYRTPALTVLGRQTTSMPKTPSTGRHTTGPDSRLQRNPRIASPNAASSRNAIGVLTRTPTGKNDQRPWSYASPIEICWVPGAHPVSQVPQTPNKFRCRDRQLDQAIRQVVGQAADTKIADQLGRGPCLGPTIGSRENR